MYENGHDKYFAENSQHMAGLTNCIIWTVGEKLNWLQIPCIYSNRRNFADKCQERLDNELFVRFKTDMSASFYLFIKLVLFPIQRRTLVNLLLHRPPLYHGTKPQLHMPTYYVWVGDHSSKGTKSSVKWILHVSFLSILEHGLYFIPILNQVSMNFRGIKEKGPM